MSKNFTIAEMKNGKATITQNERVHFCTYDAMRKAVEEVDGKIVETKEGMMKATVASKKIAEACVRKVEHGLAKARKNKATAESEVKTDKATSRTTKSTPASAKGKAIAKLEEGKIYTVKNGELVEVVPTASANAKKDARKGAKSGKKSAPTKAKWQTELDKIAHEGKGANGKATKILQKHGFKGSHGTPEWDYWMGVRA